MNKIKEILKERNGFLSLFSGFVGIIVLITAIIGLFNEVKSVGGLIILLIASIAVIGGSIVYNLYNKKTGLLALSIGSVIGLVGFRLVAPVMGHSLSCVWLCSVLIELICVISLFIKLEKKVEKDLKKRLNILPLILSIIMIAFTISLLVVLVPTKGVISMISCVIIIALIISSKILTIIKQIPSCSLIMVLVPLFTVIGMIPSEIALNSTSSVILTVLYILSFALVIAEFQLNDKKDNN